MSHTYTVHDVCTPYVRKETPKLGSQKIQIETNMKVVLHGFTGTSVSPGSPRRKFMHLTMLQVADLNSSCRPRSCPFSTYADTLNPSLDKKAGQSLLMACASCTAAAFRLRRASLTFSSSSPPLHVLPCKCLRHGCLPPSGLYCQVAHFVHAPAFI